MLAIIVPVRRASTRLPNKPLHPIAGVPLVLRVARRLKEVAPTTPAYFAVDDAEVKALLGKNGFKAIMTDPNLPSGTDRIAAANKQIKATHIINCQGDEPAVQACHIELLAKAILDGAPMATLALDHFSAEEFANPNRPKVVTGLNGNALYFSRSLIPFDRTSGGKLPGTDAMGCAVGLHQGFYAYSAEMLERFTKLPQSPLEKIEKLEQLRVLEHGYPIKVCFNAYPTQGIDTLEDVAAFEAQLKAAPHS
jgi:3-deoxy-manno-octulosonate cytidylyltransferase (CMP-KDO synthetase)